jgi:hypothetical protein
MKQSLFIFSLFSFAFGLSQNTATDGDWSQRYVKIKNTTEAELMIRHGDVDNIGLGYGAVNPFTGVLVQSRNVSLDHDPADANGFDRVMVISSFNAKKNGKGSGYHSASSELKTKYGKTVFELNLKQEVDSTIRVKDVAFQIYLIDAQAPAIGTKYHAWINKRRAYFIESVINNTDLSGQMGKLLTAKVPAEFFSEFGKPEFSLLIDDSTSGIGDGFAIDFVKLMFNPTVWPKDPSNKNEIAYTDPAPGKMRLFFEYPESKNRSKPTVTVVSTKRVIEMADHPYIDIDSLKPGLNQLKIEADHHPSSFVSIDVEPGSYVEGTIYISQTDSAKTYFQQNKNVKSNSSDKIYYGDGLIPLKALGNMNQNTPRGGSQGNFPKVTTPIFHSGTNFPTFGK